jgi:hypothetical protein
MNPSLAGGRVAKAKGLNCPNCGGSVELRGFAHTLSAVCPSCHSILDTSTPIVKVLQTVQIAQVYEPWIPLGTRGEIGGATYEVIGFQRREIPEEGEAPDGWFEYLLFNPHRGFRYLSEYRGHWNYIVVQSAIPVYTSRGGKRAATMLGRTYTHFDGVTAVTSYVVGEFPWRVQVGEVAQADDYVSPPYLLSSEIMAGEVVWSVGEYYTSEQIWRCFKLPLPPPSASGTFANQPSPREGRPRSAWKLWFWLQLALLAIALLFTATSQKKIAFEKAYLLSAPAPVTPPPATPPDNEDDTPAPPPSQPAPVTPRETSVTTDAFQLTGRTSNMQVTLDASLTGVDWAYFNLSLIDDDTKQTRVKFGREVTISKTKDGVEVPAVPSGRYRMLIEPEIHPATGSMVYTIRVRRDVPTWSWFWFASLLLLIPPIFTWIGARSFESSRWSQSNSAPAGSLPSGPEPAATDRETNL